jgi:hypothetical protein
MMQFLHQRSLVIITSSSLTSSLVVDALDVNKKTSGSGHHDTLPDVVPLDSLVLIGRSLANIAQAFEDTRTLDFLT